MRGIPKVLEKMKGGVIVSCQALADEPLHSSFVMMKMATAAMIGGAVGIRANGYDDCAEIKKNVKLPMIAICKKVYGNCNVFITPTIEEVMQLLPVKPEIIAVDATMRPRPDNISLEQFFNKIKEVYDGLLMADISTFEEAVEAERIGFDLVSTTLSSYTEYTFDKPRPDIQLIEDLKTVLSIPVIAEGNIETPDQAANCIKSGAFAVVVGSAITRPQLITKKFADRLKEGIELSSPNKE